MSDALDKFRDVLAKDEKFALLDEAGHETGIAGAAAVSYADGTTQPLEQPTRLVIDGKPTALKTVVNCWLKRDLTILEYTMNSEDEAIDALKLLERTELLAWLKGADSDLVPALDSAGRKRGYANPDERVLKDHNTVLRGEKTGDFSTISKECKRRIIVPFKQSSAKSAKGRFTEGTHAAHRPQKQLKDPIIILPSAPSSLINMMNAKQFLESGVFEPTVASAGATDLQMLSRKTRLKNSKFVIVDKVDKFKPEYWDRVVAVFVTGQEWQLKPYKWNDPHNLFHKVKGFALKYSGEPTPPTLRNWNVEVVELDRHRRFRDREVVEKIWDGIQKWMTMSGWPVNE